MVSIMEIMHLCRLCLVKDQVNIPIFEDQGDIRQIFLKITACLPVKISKEDKLPKKICDGCLYKLELLYQFWNTTANAEKQLLTWVEQINMDVNTKAAEELSSQPPEHTVKQEKIEPAESTNDNADISTEAQNYILQQQQLPYSAEYPFKESQGSNADGVEASENSEEPLPKRRRRRQATKPIPPESLDSSDNEAADTLLEMTVTKTEEESESDGDENVDDPESTKFVPVGTEDTEQPGPSGLGKGGADAPPIAEIKTENGETSAKTKKLHMCTVCDERADCPNDLANHFLTHELKYDCRMCGERFRCLYQCSLHMNQHGLRGFTCNLCSFATDKRSHFFQHINGEHLNKVPFEDKSHECVVCKKNLRSSGWLLRHQKCVHSVTSTGGLQCSICEKDYATKATLERHMSFTHNLKEKPHMCDKCGKCFSLNSQLILHYRTHTGVKPYACEFCAKSFRTKELLKEHVRIHTGEKPFSCKHCGKSFNQRTPLRVHARIHTGERPYVCQICKKGFTSKGAVDLHKKNCEGVKAKKGSSDDESDD